MWFISCFQNSFREVKKLADFLGIVADDKFLHEVCDKCSFTNLRSSYEAMKDKLADKEQPIQYAFRKGKQI